METQRSPARSRVIAWTAHSAGGTSAGNSIFSNLPFANRVSSPAPPSQNAPSESGQAQARYGDRFRTSKGIDIRTPSRTDTPSLSTVIKDRSAPSQTTPLWSAIRAGAEAFNGRNEPP